MGMRHAQLMAAASISLVDNLDVFAVRSLLKMAISESTKVSDHVRQAHQDVSHAANAREESKAVILDLSHYSRKVSHVLNKKYISENERVEENNGWLATSEIVGFILAILEETHAHPSYGTKKSAMITLQSIARSINFAPSRLGNEVIQNMGFDPTLPKTMQEIVRSMSLEERVQLAGCVQGSSTFLDKVVELVKISDDHCMWEGEIEKIVDLLRGADETDDDTDDEEEMDE
ncbi:hypothetical protein LTR10_010022 [Elasticomyces elasticus]|nr:hypothetical protein LTR10_010022 [Elasticomyces elasticus]KAK4970314.1 hypothetical protein LTR42_008481 [Elasticomyces elasticus]